MNKEEAKKLIVSTVNSDIVIKYLSGDMASLETTKALKKILSVVDQIEPDHQKVKLPREVGEDFDKAVAYLKNKYNSEDVFDVLATNLSKQKGDDYHSRLNAWYVCADDALPILADAYRYGWKAELEAKWYVQTPKEWWEDKNKPEYVDLDSMGISDGLKCKEYAAQFTRAELKKYHFDSDIFTLVPVETDKEVSR